ncbi:hypothetical protein VTN77DRAFT_2564 [Rasamsonia byssochlamydoides]|uniref:uncharacterized protein n=1 Tax=Rasamsonia byssochlamydoides TaxID=89139 RepID=UPI0037442566
MAGTPLDSSSTSTPPGAVSPDGPPRSYDEPMEDIDPQATRKRPRLDSGSASRGAMSTEESPARDSASPTAYNLEEAAEAPASRHPASRVTINMKSPTRPVRTMDGAMDDPEEPPSQEDGVKSNITPPDVDHPENNTAMTGAQSSAAISISSSPVRSPEIEVAEVEDMDQDPNTSNWRPLGEALRDQNAAEVIQLHEQMPLTDSFPKLRGNLDLRESVEEIVNMIEKGHPHDVTVFVAVKSWFDTCANNLAQISYETFVDDREFWEELPTIVEGLLRRVVNLQPNEGNGTWCCLEEFFLDFARLALHLLRLDTLALAQVAEETDAQMPEMISRTYLPSLGWILQISNIPFFRTMERLNHIELANLVARINDQIAYSPFDALQRVSDFVSCAFSLLQRWPHLAPILVSALNVIHNLVESGHERRNHGAEDDLIDSPVLVRTIKNSYILFRAVDEKYQMHISKKSPWVTADISESLLRYIGSAYQAFGGLDPSFVLRLARDLSVELPEDAKSDEYLPIIHFSWRFSLLKRHIMEGRMELRVFGMETMQSDLVSVWRQHIQGNPDGIENSIIQYLVKFLRDNRIVEYIVGVDSHPQLISRSGNIVGFLVVTSTYIDADTDTIWKAVTESQDQRTVGEVLAMLTRTFIMHPASSNALLYLCSKLLELPLNRFDSRMIEFCEQLLLNVREKHGERSRHEPLDILHVDSIPLRLCVRLIRESTACHEFSVEHKTSLQKFASVQLSQFLSLGMSEADKLDVYERCIQDIAEMNQFASGSIQALNALLPAYDSHEIRKLTSDFDLTRLGIMEFCHFWETEQSDFTDSFSKNALLSRIQLLNRIIDKVPETITPDLSDTLWTRVFMTGNVDQARAPLWDMLCRVTGHCGTPNPFIERCLHEYLPDLPPEKYSPEILAFAEQAVAYEIRFNPPPVPGENEIISLPGMDRIWHLILTAPPGTIESKATSFAIEVYLDHTLIRRAPPSTAEATHISLVDRCVEQIRSAAGKLKAFKDGSTSGEDESMVAGADEHEIRAEELRFSRSLLFLQQLLQGIRTRPQYSPPQGQPPDLPERIGKGDPIEIPYQCFNGGSQSKVRTLQIGDLCTASELVDRLVRLTGFTKFSTIYGGQKINLLENPDATLRELRFRAGLLIIRKINDGPEVSLTGRRQSLTLVDSEVLKHFDDLYDLLSLEDRFAKEIYDFLSVFPPQERVLELVRSESNTEQEMFPMEKPYQLLYSVKALSTCLREASLETEPNQAFISHSIQTLVAALTRPQMAESLTENPMKLVFACHLIECLLSALSVRAGEALAALPNPDLLIRQLLNFIESARDLTTSELSEASIQKLICQSFAVLIEGSVHDSGFWAVIKQHAQFDRLIFTLLLQEKRQSIRKEIADNIAVVCGPSKSRKKSTRPGRGDADGLKQPENPTTVDILGTLWEAFVHNFSHTVEYAEQSQEFFGVALAVFRSVAERSPRDVIFAEYLTQWSKIMLSHKTEEFVGREPEDHVILGFSRLLRLCLEIADQTDTRINATELIESLFNNYLFPDLSVPSDTEVITPRVPVMHEETREELYNILVLLCKHVENYAKVIDLVSDLIPQDYTYSPNWTFERSKTIRSPEGYAGLKNLSNTCYLNSLFSQLFMNVGFREFMLQLPLSDPECSQKLLAETKKIFGNMQETWSKFVDPQGAVDSIRTYDNEPIDVTIQMDVDEFYNLLFDRWEAQIVDPEDKKRFRSFYGGQLVQQIKSKECSHISERLEPFSAIQCDIKGKASLEDSLQAYVEGEIMQGDNKYSCTPCGRHVDAVKRACLKELPDNLIFHLKRFDFDMVTMMRSKINDEFQFPERIDMTPYKVEYLSNPNSNVEPDIFELVGVLVHSGTAESGHYYSYIRERPVAGSKRSWVEFNDADVSAFDPSKIAEQCFGGLNDPIHGSSMGQARFGKVWNAYMLFYQRVSSMEAAKEIYKPSEKDIPVRVPLPVRLGNHIAMDNELFIRTYCLLDPYHASFVRYLLSLSRDFVLSGASGASKLEKTAIFIALDTLDQLVSRTRELSELDKLVAELARTIADTPKGAHKVIQWIAERPTGMRNLILKTPHAAVRSNSSRIFIRALARLQELQEDPNLSDIEREKWRTRYSDAFRTVVAALEDLWPVLHTASRSWDDYFEFLCMLATFRVSQVGILLDHGFLLKCLEIVWLDREDTKKLKRHYAAYYRLIERGRRFSHRKLLDFLVNLMRFIDLTLPPTADGEPRIIQGDRYSLTESENSLIRTLGRGKELLVLKKILQQHSNPPACRALTGLFLDSEPEAGLLDPICKVLEDGLRVAPAALCAPFLEATLIFCRRSPDEDQIVGLIDYVAKGVESINNSGGKEHLAFFSNLLSIRNERIGKDETWFSTHVVERIPDWAPTLLIYVDKTVRSLTFDFLRQILFNKEHEEMSDECRLFYTKVAKDLTQASVERLRKTYLVTPGQNIEAKVVETINLVINHCLEMYYDEGDEEDAEFMQQAAAVSSAIEELSVELPEELASESDFPSPEDWEDNSMMASDSELGLAGTP